MKTYKKLNSLKRWNRSFILFLAVIIFGINNGYAQHVFSITYNELSRENVRQISMQAERSRTAVAPLSRNISGEYTLSLSANARQNTKIILLNAETGGNVVITPTEYAPAEFVLSPFFIEELRQATLGDANSFLIMETGADFSLRSVSTVSRATEDIFIPRMFYGTKENMREALPRDRRIVHIFKKRPRLIPAFPDDPENLRLIAQLEEEMSYFVYMYELPDGTFVIFDENFVSESATESTAGRNTTISNFGPLRFNLSGNLNRDQREVTQYALNLWGQYLWGRVPISVNVRAIPMLQGVLGVARQQPHYLSPVTRTWYSSALGNQLAGFNVVHGVYDILIEMNSGHNWNYSITSSHGGRFDWLTVMLHEIAHGLGFASLIYWDWTTQNNGRFVFRTRGGPWEFTDYPGAFDRQLFHGSTGLNNLPYLTHSQRATAVTSNDLFAGRPGSHLLAANNGNRVRMYAPSIWNGGSSVSHWHTSGTPYLMRPSLRSGVRQSIDAREIAIMRDMGWPVPMAIAGPAVICTQERFEIANLPSDATVYWTAVGNGTLSATAGQSVIVTASTNVSNLNPVTLIARINFPQNPNLIRLQRTIQVRRPSHHQISSVLNREQIPSFQAINGFEDAITYYGVVAGHRNPYGIIAGEWRQTPGSNVVLSEFKRPSLIFNAFVGVNRDLSIIRYVNGIATMEVRLQNVCGWSDWATIEYRDPNPSVVVCRICGRPNCGGCFVLDPICIHCRGAGCPICSPVGFVCPVCGRDCRPRICGSSYPIIFSPNPVSNILTIDLTQADTSTSLSDRGRASEETIFDIRLLNSHGMIVRQQRTQARSIQFDVSNLPEGTYYLHIEHNGEVEMHQIVVQRN